MSALPFTFVEPIHVATKYPAALDVKTDGPTVPPIPLTYTMAFGTGDTDMESTTQYGNDTLSELEMSLPQDAVGLVGLQMMRRPPCAASTEGTPRHTNIQIARLRISMQISHKKCGSDAGLIQHT
jgi:hypothetical protein